MQANEGLNDRLVRAAICGAALVGIKACPAPSGKIGSLLIAAYAGYTAATGSCPAYRALGVSTAL